MLRYVLVIMFKIFVPGLYLWFSCYRYQYCNIKLNRKEQGKTIMNKNILHISICQTINRKGGERKLLNVFCTTVQNVYELHGLNFKKKRLQVLFKKLLHIMPDRRYLNSFFFQIMSVLLNPCIRGLMPNI